MRGQPTSHDFSLEFLHIFFWISVNLGGNADWVHKKCEKQQKNSEKWRQTNFFWGEIIHLRIVFHTYAFVVQMDIFGEF